MPGDAGIGVAGPPMGLSFSGNLIPCTHPGCGGMARIIEGDMLVGSEGIEVLTGPAWSWEVVDRLGLTLQRILDEKPDDPEAQLAQAVPELAAAVTMLVDELKAQRPRTGRRALAMKVTRVILSTLATCGVGVAIQEGVDAVQEHGQAAEHQRPDLTPGQIQHLIDARLREMRPKRPRGR